METSATAAVRVRFLDATGAEVAVSGSVGLEDATPGRPGVAPYGLVAEIVDGDGTVQDAYALGGRKPSGEGS
ncbi:MULTISPECIES: hypothetical protein [unclassified Streptomyces]|uniref:hypothetical protein n=1 Tax=unclassified Streptomyces TaxID=2593676 RepID=UPI00225AD873|nr:MULTISPECIES: hypothetical protein [unclassified Streptomyces]MCX4641982.1 hypothetical protein [Streptomyces sp. NBC_01446]MCX5085714.1 hypothetical protein [Streptomyces sp. NBC_00401]MCX5326855.1 hypothetical protein [Streptomyces sp. NBC_00120]